MKCFYHSSDFDGLCSAAIVKYKYPDCELFPINYGDEFPWNETRDSYEVVFMVDFCLQPFIDMVTLNKRCWLIWIDHHGTAIQSAIESGEEINGCRIEGQAGCELTWDWIFGTKRPKAVSLLGRYDVWQYKDNNEVLPFQYGMRLENADPRNPEVMKNLWIPLFNGNNCNSIIQEGHTVLKYENQVNEKFCKSYAFETELRIPEGVLGKTYNLKAICLNRGLNSSKVFESVWDNSKYDIMVGFCRRNKKWDVSLYSDKLEIHCGEIAKIFKGGGHVGAAGCQVDELPFDY